MAISKAEKRKSKTTEQELSPETRLALETICSGEAGSVNDPLYETIDVTSLIKEVFDLPEIQRLRNIRQLGFLELVFPSATHSRFEHSLGTMNLAGIALDAIIRNTEKIVESNRKFAETETKDRKKNLATFLGSVSDCSDVLRHINQYKKEIKVRVQLAALLHDCGHGPFSHAIEQLMPTNNLVLQRNEVPEFLTSYAEKLNGEDKASHELMGLLMAPKLILTACKKLLRQNEIDQDQINIFAANLAQDVCAILNKDLDVSPGSPLKVSSLSLAPTLSMLVSGDIDVDRMDYLSRDSHHCGLTYGKYDSGRLLRSLALYRNKKGNVSLAIRTSGLSAFEHFLFARHQMHVQVYSHKTENAANSMLEYLSDELSSILKEKNVESNLIPAEIEAYIEMTDSAFIRKVSQSIEDLASEADYRTKALYLKTVLNGLFTQRKLWKKCFESKGDGGPHEQTVQSRIMKLLADEDVPHRMYNKSKSIGGEMVAGKSWKRPEKELAALRKNLWGQYYLQTIKQASPVIESLYKTHEFFRVFFDSGFKDGMADRLRNIVQPDDMSKSMAEILDPETKRKKELGRSLAKSKS